MPQLAQHPKHRSHASQRTALRACGLQIAALYRLQGQRLTLRGTVIDMSANGILLVTSKPLMRHQVIQLQFKVPDGPQITTQAQVVRCEAADNGQYAAGITFSLDIHNELALVKWVFAHVTR